MIYSARFGFSTKVATVFFQFTRPSVCLYLLPLTLLALFTALPLRAQVDLGQLTGRIKDSTGAVIPGAKVVATSISTGAIRTTKTNAAGIYTIPGVPQGGYQLRVSASGFGIQETNAMVNTGTTTTQDFALTIESNQQQVVVDATPATDVQTESYEVRTTLTTEDLTQEPNNGRNPLAIALTAPQTAGGSDTAEHTSSAQSFASTGNEVVLGGGLDVQTGYIQDGVENVALLTQTANVLPSVESIREMSVITNGADARYRQPGVINITTRSGTKNFHGTAYDFFQNDYLNALPYNFSTVAPSPTPLRYNLFGGNVGGPVWPSKKIFAFFDYSGLRDQSTTTNLSRVPTTAELQGDFSADKYTLYDPTSYNAATGSNVSYISETGKNAIPTPFDAFAVQYLKQFFPTANIPLDTVQDVNYQAPITVKTLANTYLARADWDRSVSDQIYGSLGYAYNYNLTPTISPNYFGQIYFSHGVNVLAEETHVFSSRLVNTGRVGYNRSNYFQTIQGVGQQNYDSTLGLQNLNPQPTQWAPPYVVFSINYPTLGNTNSPQGAIQNRVEIADQLFLSLGSHSIFLGGELFKTYFDGNWVISNNGSYTYNGTFTSSYSKGVRSTTNTGDPLADFLLGFPQAAVGATGTTVGSFRETEVAGFFSDTWRVIPRLTLNLGIRYQFDNPPNDANGHSSIYDLPSNQNYSGTWRTNYGDIAPRVGFAYALNSKTVIRGGAGIYYAGNPYNSLQFLLAHAPNFFTQAPTFTITDPTKAETIFSANPDSSGQRPMTVQLHMPDTNVQEFNLILDRQLSKVLKFTAGYTGEVGRHEAVRVNSNQPNNITPGSGSALFNQHPYPYVGDVFDVTNAASSNGNAFQAVVKAHSRNGSHALVSYAWSKSLNTSDGDRYVLADYYNPRLNYAPAAFDRTHTLTVSGIYHLPFGGSAYYDDFSAAGVRGTRKLSVTGGDKQIKTRDNTSDATTTPSRLQRFSQLAIAGWQLSAIYHLATGRPVDVTETNEADTSSLETVYAQKICNPTVGFIQSRSEWFNRSCFAQSAPLTYGVGGRNSVREPRLDNIDIGLGKTFLLTERQHLQFRAELFNAPNHPQFSLSGTKAVTSSSVGVLNGISRPMRSMQLALRYTF